jgi:membrane protease YdiL (CAAX protease family)
MTDLTTVAPPASRRRLWAEFLTLFVGAPLLMLAFFGQYSLFLTLWALAGVAALLLALTPGFRWRMLLRLPRARDWALVALAGLGAAAVCLPVVLWLSPGSLLWMPRYNPGLWTMIMVAYPLLSALPQELIYRSLFFERYGMLFPDRRVLILANGALFGFGHLFYFNPVVIAMTAVGGAAMGWAYARERSLALAWAVHAVMGQAVFTMGLGRYFYSGAVS